MLSGNLLINMQLNLTGLATSSLQSEHEGEADPERTRKAFFFNAECIFIQEECNSSLTHAVKSTVCYIYTVSVCM